MLPTLQKKSVFLNQSLWKLTQLKKKLKKHYSLITLLRNRFGRHSVLAENRRGKKALLINIAAIRVPMSCYYRNIKQRASRPTTMSEQLVIKMSSSTRAAIAGTRKSACSSFSVVRDVPDPVFSQVTRLRSKHQGSQVRSFSVTNTGKLETSADCKTPFWTRLVCPALEKSTLH